jgi:hypothetical protein
MGNPTVTPLQEAWHDGGFIVSEANGHISRDTVALTGGVLIQAGTVLGQQTVGATAVAAALGTNAGNGTFGAIAVGVGAVPGVYTVEFNDATHYVVNDPLGSEVGHGTTGVAFSAGGLAFTITAGGTAFVAADSFTVTPAAGTGKFAPLNVAATNGSAVAAGVLFGARDTTTADKKGIAIVRSAELNASELTWPTGATTPQIAAGTAQLRALGIILR